MHVRKMVSVEGGRGEVLEISCPGNDGQTAVLGCADDGQVGIESVFFWI